MSTYWYFECLNHDPPLRSEDEFTQHTDDAWYQQGVQLANSRPVAEDDGEYWRVGSRHPEAARLYFRMNARNFLHHHPSCRIGAVNEYGERRSLECDDMLTESERRLAERSGEEASMGKAITWTGTETSAQMIRDAVIETDGRCEYRFTTRLTSLYGDELTIDMPQRIVVLKRGQSITHDTDGWIKSDG